VRPDRFSERSKRALGYARADATFAVNHVDADWNKEAVEAARDYLDTVPMSGAELTQQLSSSAGDGFTLAQATHAVSKVGLYEQRPQPGERKRSGLATGAVAFGQGGLENSCPSRPRMLLSCRAALSHPIELT
jgi:hypothetical protein